VTVSQRAGKESQGPAVGQYRCFECGAEFEVTFASPPVTLEQVERAAALGLNPLAHLQQYPGGCPACGSYNTDLTFFAM
jgi:hypothetical protein